MLRRQGGNTLALQLLLFSGQAQLLAADVGQTGVRLLGVGGHHDLLLLGQVGQLLVDLRPQSGDFLFQDKLLVVIPLREHHKPLVGQLSAGVVLVGLGEKPVQFGTSGQVGPKFLLAPRTLTLGHFQGLCHQQLYKVLLLVLQEGRQPSDLQKHDLFQRVYPDIVRLIACTPVAR